MAENGMKIRGQGGCYEILIYEFSEIFVVLFTTLLFFTLDGCWVVACLLLLCALKKIPLSCFFLLFGFCFSICLSFPSPLFLLHRGERGRGRRIWAAEMVGVNECV